MERELRYLVFKYKDINKYLTDEDKESLMAIVSKISKGRCDDNKTQIECVVVENDWPMYEDTWKAIENYVDGNGE